MTPLLAAAQSGNVQVVSELLDNGASAQAARSNGVTPLHYAAEAGHVYVSFRLLAAGADPLVEDDRGRSPLAAAVAAGHTDIVLAVVGALGDASLIAEILKLAVDSGQPEIIPALLEAGDASAMGDVTLRVLIAAAIGDTEALTTALDTGADPNWKSRGGYSALALAVRGRHSEVVAALLDRGSDLDSRSASGFTPLMWAAEARDSAMIERLLDAGASVDRSTNWGWTPLMSAASAGDAGSVRALLAAGASVDSRLRRSLLTLDAGYTPLMLAAQGGYGEVLELLLAAGAAPNRRAGGITPLMLATDEDHAEAVGVLLEAGARSGTLIYAPQAMTYPGRDMDGRTALTIAMMNGYGDVVIVLLDHAAARPVIPSSTPGWDRPLPPFERGVRSPRRPPP